MRLAGPAFCLPARGCSPDFRGAVCGMPPAPLTGVPEKKGGGQRARRSGARWRELGGTHGMHSHAAPRAAPSAHTPRATACRVTAPTSQPARPVVRASAAAPARHRRRPSRPRCRRSATRTNARGRPTRRRTGPLTAREARRRLPRRRRGRLWSTGPCQRAARSASRRPWWPARRRGRPQHAPCPQPWRGVRLGLRAWALRVRSPAPRSGCPARPPG